VLDQAAARTAFDRASATYDSAAGLQARVRSTLIGQLERAALRPLVALDLGAGTGQGARELSLRYPQATVMALDFAPGMLLEAQRRSTALNPFHSVCADALRLPIRSASVDVVFSNLMLQWCNPFDAFSEIRRILRPNGRLQFSTLGPGTLHELRAAWAAVDTLNHVNRFVDAREIQAALGQAGFETAVLEIERIELAFPDALSVMRSLKAIGAQTVTGGRSPGLTGKHRLGCMTEAYESFRKNGSVPATYEVIFGAAARGASGRDRATKPNSISN